MVTMSAIEFKAALEELAAVADMLPDETKIISGRIGVPFFGGQSIHIMNGLDQIAAAVHLPVVSEVETEGWIHKRVDLGAVTLKQAEKG